jgi:F-type H+-transporting ATPase subunit delta
MYAGALFGAAREQGRVDPVQRDLAMLAEALEQTPELQAFLANPQVDPPSKAAVLDEVSEGADELVRNFLRLVSEKGRAGELAEIAADFQALVDEAEGRLSVQLITAHVLSDEEASAIVRRIEEASGRTVEATRSVDPQLLGGLILQAGSLRADASVRGRLNRLRRELVHRG